MSPNQNPGRVGLLGTAFAALAIGTLIPLRRILGSTTTGGGSVQSIGRLVKSLPGPKRAGRVLYGYSALPKGRRSNATFADSYGCTYHFGHDGRIRLGKWQEAGSETPRDEKGVPLRGRARRRVMRRFKITAQAYQRRPVTTLLEQMAGNNLTA